MNGWGKNPASDDNNQSFKICIEILKSNECTWSMILCRNYEKALHVMQQATAMPAKKVAYFDSTEPVQMRLYKNLKVWSMYADLEESLGTFEVLRTLHSDKIICATCKMSLVYCLDTCDIRHRFSYILHFLSFYSQLKQCTIVF